MRYSCIFLDTFNRSLNTQKMSRIQFVDLDTLSDDEDAGSVLISQHEMRTRLRWCNPIGVPHIKQEIEGTDMTKDVTETQKMVQIQDQLLQEV